MKVYKKTWPANSYWLIMYAQMKTDKNVSFYGINFWNGVLQSQKIEKI